MSAHDVELRALLADSSQCGAYFVDMGDRDALVSVAQGLGFAMVSIDFADCRDKDDALTRIAQALDFPEWFGGNWDALADCLSDLSWKPADGYVLLLDNIQAWRTAAPGDFDTASDIFNEAATEWMQVRKPFWALMPLPAKLLAEMPE